MRKIKHWLTLNGEWKLSQSRDWRETAEEGASDGPETVERTGEEMWPHMKMGNARRGRRREWNLCKYEKNNRCRWANENLKEVIEQGRRNEMTRDEIGTLHVMSHSPIVNGRQTTGRIRLMWPRHYCLQNQFYVEHYFPSTRGANARQADTVTNFVVWVAITSIDDVIDEETTNKPSKCPCLLLRQWMGDDSYVSCCRTEHKV